MRDAGNIHKRLRWLWKNVRVSAGETSPSVTVELIPGSILSGRIVDEDGDPLNGCIVQPRPAIRSIRPLWRHH